MHYYCLLYFIDLWIKHEFHRFNLHIVQNCRSAVISVGLLKHPLLNLLTINDLILEKRGVV